MAKPVTSSALFFMTMATIVSVALGLGYGLGSNAAALTYLPEPVRLIFGGSGIVPAALVAIILNVCLPREYDHGFFYVQSLSGFLIPIIHGKCVQNLLYA